jgi:signal transduction histidine kinase
VGRDQFFVADAVVPVMVAAVIAAGVVVRADPATAHLAFAIALASAAVLAARRRAPAMTLAVSGGLVLALFAIDPAAGAAAVFAPAVALYTVGLRRGRAHQLLAALAAVAAVIATDVFLAGRHTVTPQTIAHAALVAVPLLAAEALRTRRSYISLLLERLELAERTRQQEARRLVEQERLRIARDLHDVVAHTLTTINVQAGVAAHLLDRNPEHARGALATIEDASRDALDELRAVVGVLRDPDTNGGPGASADAGSGTGTVPLEPVPTVGAVGDLVERARSSGLDVNLDIYGDQPERLPDAVGLAAFRIVQESLTNVRRHAPGAPTQVRLTFEPGRMLVAVDNGAGSGDSADATSNTTTVPGAGAGPGTGVPISAVGTATGVGTGAGIGTGKGAGPGAHRGVGTGTGTGVGAGAGPGVPSSAVGTGTGVGTGVGIGTGKGKGTSTGLGVGTGTGVGAGMGAGMGVGIIGMKERAAAVGGTLEAAPFPDGFRVRAELPYRRAEATE